MKMAVRKKPIVYLLLMPLCGLINTPPHLRWQSPKPRSGMLFQLSFSKTQTFCDRSSLEIVHCSSLCGNDPDAVKACVQRQPASLAYASLRLRENQNVVRELALVSRNPFNMRAIYYETTQLCQASLERNFDLPPESIGDALRLDVDIALAMLANNPQHFSKLRC